MDAIRTRDSKARTPTAAGALMILFAALLFLPASPAWAAGFVVTKTADTNDGICDTDCSLREAIAAANANANDETDAITFDLPDGPNTITLGGTQLEIASDLTITGPGANRLRVSGNNASRVFDITSGNTVEVSGLTITGDSNNEGGGISNAGTLTLNESVASGNSAFIGGGVYNTGILTLSESAVSGNMADIVGGVYNAGSLTLSESAVSGNSTYPTSNGNGGGILNAGTLEINESVVSGNSAFIGGGVYNAGSLTLSESAVSGNSATLRGGGILNSFGTLTVSESTVSGNSATEGGGVYSNTSSNSTSSKTTMINSTVSGNIANLRGGGVRNENGLTEIENSTITKNTAPQSAGGGVSSIANNTTHTAVSSSIISDNANSDDVSSGSPNTFQSNGYNLIGGGNATEAFIAANNDQTGVADPGLKDLADYGGSTQTHALMTDSPALNAGDPDECPPPTTDQRGIERPQGGRCDIGAFELEQATASTSPESLGFGETPVDGRSEVRTVTVTNTGEAELEIKRADIVGENLSSFQKTGDACSGETVAPGGRCEIRIRFTPEESGGVDATLTIVSNDPASPTQVSLTGTGTIAPAPEVDSMTPDNGEQGETLPVTITGSGFSDGATAYLVRDSVRLGVSDVEVNAEGITGELAIPDGFPTGKYDAVVENPDGKSGTRSGAFEVTTAPEPAPNPLGCTIFGTPGNDVLRGTPGRDIICGLGGNDAIRGLGGNDTIYGGPGNDRIFGQGGNDLIRGGPGNDRLVGGADDDRLIGGPGRDRLFGQGGDDILNARDGVRGNDIANGGPGRDRCASDPRDVRRSCP